MGGLLILASCLVATISARRSAERVRLDRAVRDGRFSARSVSVTTTLNCGVARGQGLSEPQKLFWQFHLRVRRRGGAVRSTQARHAPDLSISQARASEFTLVALRAASDGGDRRLLELR